jgi:hypothetical protein
VFSVAASGAYAQCAGPPGIPFNCKVGTAPQPADLLYGGSQAQLAAGNGGGSVSFAIGLLFANAPPITSPSGTFGTLNVTGTFSGPAFATFLSSPPPIGNTAPNSGLFTTLNASTSLGLPVWTTSSRPSSPSTGVIGWNTTTSAIDEWNGTAWVTGSSGGSFASPPPLGNTTPNTVASTSLSVSNTVAWSGVAYPPAANAGLFNLSTYTGSPATPGLGDTGGQEVPLNSFLVTSDQLNWNPGPGAVTALEIFHYFGGGSATGARASVIIDSRFNGTIANDNGGFTPLQIFQSVGAGVNVTGAASGAGNGRGTTYMLSGSYARMGSGTFLHSASATEFDYQPVTGSSIDYSYGVKMVNGASAGYHANLFEAAFSLGTAPSSSTWNNGLYFGDPQGISGTGFPISPTGVAINFAAGTLGTVLDASAVTSTYFLKGPNNFAVLNNNRVVSDQVSPASANVYQIGNTQGNPIAVFSSSANAITQSLTLVNQNANAFLIDVTANPTVGALGIGRTNATALNLGGSTNNVTIGAGVPIATSSTAGFLELPTMAGTPTGTVGVTGLAAVVIDTTDKKICYSVGGGLWECSAAFTP